MSNELTVIQGVTNVGQALMSMAVSAKNLGMVRKKNAIVLAEELCNLKYACRQQGIIRLAETTLDAMDRTNTKIQQMNHTGSLLEMDLALLDLQYKLLVQNLQGYASHR